MALRPPVPPTGKVPAPGTVLNFYCVKIQNRDYYLSVYLLYGRFTAPVRCRSGMNVGFGDRTKR